MNYRRRQKNGKSRFVQCRKMTGNRAAIYWKEKERVQNCGKECHGMVGFLEGPFQRRKLDYFKFFVRLSLIY